MSMGSVTSQETKLIHCCKMRNRFLKNEDTVSCFNFNVKTNHHLNQFISTFNGSIIELKWMEPTIKANHHSQPDVLNSRAKSVNAEFYTTKYLSLGNVMVFFKLKIQLQYLRKLYQLVDMCIVQTTFSNFSAFASFSHSAFHS